MDFHDRRSGTIVTLAENTNKAGTTDPINDKLQQGTTRLFRGKAYTSQSDRMSGYRPKPTDTDSLVRHSKYDPPYAPGEGISKRRVKTK